MRHTLTVGEINRRLKNDGWMAVGLDKMCPKCGEDRIITATTIYGRTKFHCDVCSTTWLPNDAETL